MVDACDDNSTFKGAYLLETMKSNTVSLDVQRLVGVCKYEVITSCMICLCIFWHSFGFNSSRGRAGCFGRGGADDTLADK